MCVLRIEGSCQEVIQDCILPLGKRDHKKHVVVKVKSVVPHFPTDADSGFVNIVVSNARVAQFEPMRKGSQRPVQ